MKRLMLIGSWLAAAVLLSIALVTASPLASRADVPAKPCAVGDRVVQKSREFKIRTDKDGGSARAVPIGSWHVDKVEGGIISLWSESFGSGLIEVDQVVRVDDAMKFFSDRIRDNPQDAFAHVMLAVLWRDKGEFDKALANSDEAIRIDPRAAVAYETRAAVWLEKSEPKKALVDCNEALLLDPLNVLALVRRGTAFMDMNQTDKALDDFNQAIRLAPPYSTALVDRGWALVEKKEYDRALADFTEAIRVNPHDGSALRNRAGICAIKRKYDRSISDYTDAIRLNPRDSMALLGRSVLWHETNADDMALSDLNEVIRIGPDEPHGRHRTFAASLAGSQDSGTSHVAADFKSDSILATAYYNRALVWTCRRRFDKALADLNEAIRLAPEHGSSYSARGFLKLEQGELDSAAIEDLDHAVLLEPSNSRHYVIRGQIRFARKQCEQAIADYTEALRLSPRDSEAYELRAQAWAEKQEYDKAIADCDEAIRLDAKFAEAHALRANVLLVIGRFDEAVAGCTEAIRLDPKRADFRSVRAQAYCETHEFDKAIVDCNEALHIKPDDVVALEVKPNALNRMKELDKIIADYTAAIGTDPKNSATFANRARSWFYKGEYDRAIADCIEAIKLDPKNFRALYARGDAWLKKGNRPKAFDDYTAGAAFDPAHAEPSEDIASEPSLSDAAEKRAESPFGDFIPEHTNEPVAVKTDRSNSNGLATSPPAPETLWTLAGSDKKQALFSAEPASDDLSSIGEKASFIQVVAGPSALKMSFEDTLGRDVPGQNFFLKRDYDMAIAECSASIERDSDVPQAYLVRARAYLAKGEYKSAVADLENVTRLEPTNNFAWDLLAQIQSACPDDAFRDGKKAVKAATRACEPTEWKKPSYLETLAAAYAEAGDFASAVTWESKAIELETLPRDMGDYRARLKLYQEKKPYREARP